MRRKIFSLLLFIFLFQFIAAEAHETAGFVVIKSDRHWIIKIADSLLTNGNILKLDSGTYTFYGRPQSSYSWPATFSEGTVSVAAQDTVIIVPENFIIKEEIETERLDNFKSFNNKPLSQPPVAYRQYVKNGLILSAVGTNWLSFYLKRVADDYYDRYGQNSSLPAINRDKQKMKQFDTYSQVTLGISAALLAAYIYISLTE
jgi:hypothetical protein